MKREICVPEVPARQMVLTIITDEQGITLKIGITAKVDAIFNFEKENNNK